MSRTTGLERRHGPHHGAEKNTRIGFAGVVVVVDVGGLRTAFVKESLVSRILAPDVPNRGDMTSVVRRARRDFGRGVDLMLLSRDVIDDGELRNADAFAKGGGISVKLVK
mmetsp:Transcript_12509/g.15701  ORF Transcript_12509/g.15701 Transcript_12509/m.15701 type:complete len:110 (-) Transcript_12509:220-549(-)